VVPVGEDQRQHLELTRDVALRFNSRFGQVFTIPQAKILTETAKIFDLQQPTAKMSKSSADPKGVLNLMDTPDEISKKIRVAVTDTDGEMRFDREQKPGLANLIGIHSAISGESTDSIVQRFAGEGYGKLKQEVAEVVIEALNPIRLRTLELLGDSGELDRLLAAGAERAHAVASDTLSKVYDALGFLPQAN
jgi:tryptophanyl-tRNA synthetase